MPRGAAEADEREPGGAVLKPRSRKALKPLSSPLALIPRGAAEADERKTAARGGGGSGGAHDRRLRGRKREIRAD